MSAEVREVSQAEGAEVLDRAARYWLGITGEEFLRQWDAKELTWDSAPNVTTIAMLIPFARPVAQ